jgi:hypothetical protein
MQLTNAELAAQLRALADIYEAHPEIAQLYEFTQSNSFVFCHDKETFAATVKAFGAGKKKNGVAQAVNFVPDAFPKLLITSWKDKVCERVVVGTREIPERVVPATEGYVVPARTEEIVEYRCTPFLKTEEEPAKERESFKDLILDEELYDGAAFV